LVVKGLSCGKLLAAAGICISIACGGATDSSGANCTFRADPDRFLASQIRVRAEIAKRTAQFQARKSSPARTVAPAAIPRRNFIDNEIFDAMANAGVQSAPLSGDEEFFRRINLDLTGRIPSSAEIRAFIADTDPGKRSRTIDRLLNSDEFVDKWVVWLGDLLRNSATNAVSNSPEQLAGRNTFYKYIWASLVSQKSLRDIAYDVITGGGNNYDEPNGSVNFISSTATPGGPIQDTYDAMLVKTTTAFLGLGHYDCLLCHNGRGHLDSISLWAKNTNRIDAQRMSAFFARVNVIRWPTPAGLSTQEAQQLPYYNSYSVQDVVARTYDLNTNYGNRPNRTAQNGVAKLTPIYQFTGATPKDDGWRSAFADNVVNDPMFARNMVNRLWKQLFNLGLVDPVDMLDPARLDPANPPPDGWTLQATHPVLLDRLSKEFTREWYNLRGTIRLMVESNAYQLSSRYDGDWNASYVPLFARHYPRRLDGEEVHDAIAKATGVFTAYTQFNWGGTVKWAMQLLDPVEPRSNGTAAAFMNNFLRGNRDTVPRSQASTLQQQLALMNDAFVIPKIKIANSPVLQAVAKLPSNDAMIDEMFLTFISRAPDSYERTRALAYLDKATTAAAKNAALEDLAWVLINKVDFLFSY
jgi:hypothetical protein